MVSCFQASKKAKLCTGVFLFAGALACFFSIVPVYMGTLATPAGEFVDCMECAFDYGKHVIDTVNATSIIEKIEHAHEENQKDHHGRHDRSRHDRHKHDEPDVCITEEDLDNLQLDDLDIDPFPKACAQKCAPIGLKVPLAMVCAGVVFAAALILLLTSLFAFCTFCCCNAPPPPTYVMVESGMPSTSMPLTHHGLQPTGTAYSDSAKQPLMHDA